MLTLYVTLYYNVRESECIILSKKDKQIQAIRNNPRNVRFDTLRNILLSHGFVESAPGGGSSHYTYHRGIYRITVPKDNPVNQVYVKKVVEILDKLEAEQ